MPNCVKNQRLPLSADSLNPIFIKVGRHYRHGRLTSIEIETALTPECSMKVFGESLAARFAGNTDYFGCAAIYLGATFGAIPAWHMTQAIAQALDTARLVNFDTLQQVTFSARSIGDPNPSQDITRIFLTNEYEQIQRAAFRSANDIVSIARGTNELVG